MALLLAVSGQVFAAPTLGQPDQPLSDPEGLPVRSGAATATGPAVSTGQRHLDLLLEQQGVATAGGPSAGGAPAVTASAASMPRAADLRQTLRVEALTRGQGQARDVADNPAKALGVGAEGETALREADRSDPTLRRTWDGPRETAAPAGQGAAGGGDGSPLGEMLREFVDFLRSHRIEFFALLGLIGVGLVVARLYARSR